MTNVIVGTGNRVQTVLNVRTLRVDTTASRTSEGKILCLRTKRRLSSLKWEGEIQVSHRTVRSKDELKSELENSASVYGVWGENSRAFFEKWLNAKVIDISFCFFFESVHRDFFERYQFFRDHRSLRRRTTRIPPFDRRTVQPSHFEAL
ncbi:hypothetical protein AVEN_38383-1 [Araneus ventricosus]|uniref:Uncharacterized protein n=1 Tax=Araneus ventricosus TaxID=182803 RepID=A0A4Y2SQY3_ARAVE|nr:hypothetical protein AVEN_38383-1 [Araneus ventricosus]